MRGKINSKCDIQLKGGGQEGLKEGAKENEMTMLGTGDYCQVN